MHWASLGIGNDRPNLSRIEGRPFNKRHRSWRPPKGVFSGLHTPIPVLYGRDEISTFHESFVLREGLYLGCQLLQALRRDNPTLFYLAAVIFTPFVIVIGESHGMGDRP